LARVNERLLSWEGCYNVRDLGGHPTAHGPTTRFGAVVRADSPAGLTERGWAALRAHGTRTIVDLRDPSERDGEAEPATVDRVFVPVLDLADSDFWESWRGPRDTLAFYRSALERWQDRFASAVVAVARARDGGVLVHCQVGRDRTGLVCALLLASVGVPPPSIAEDYALSAALLRPLYDRWVSEAPEDERRLRLAGENVSERGVMLEILDRLDVRAYLLEGGATEGDLDRLRRRLVDPD
jgi:protein-tyrosine phosphatase